jgi:hypothetical protein
MARARLAAAAIFLLGGAMQAAAQQAEPSLGPMPLTPLPRPTETGKPLIFDPQAAAKADHDRTAGCAPGWSCRVRLLGVIEKNGAVELKGTAFSW